MQPETGYAAAWRELVVADGFAFRRERQRGPVGEGRGLWVSSEIAPGRLIYMKPTVAEHRAYCSRAAREKICSDLGYDLKVGVPPVVLADRPNRGNHEHHVALSMRLYPQQEDLEATEAWLEGSSVLGAVINQLLPVAASRAYAFDMWVGQTDHRDASPDNIHFGWDHRSEARGFVFLDFAMALGFKGSWRDGGHATAWDVPFPSFLAKYITSDDLEAAVTDVEALSDEAIDGVGQRIPDRFMPQVERDVVAQGLRERKARLRDMIIKPRGTP